MPRPALRRTSSSPGASPAPARGEGPASRSARPVGTTLHGVNDATVLHLRSWSAHTPPPSSGPDAPVPEASMTKRSRSDVTRRGFLGATAAVAVAPIVAHAQQAPISLRFQSTWPTKDIFHEYALDFAKRVNDMSGRAVEDRRASRRRGGEGVRPARRRAQGHARRWSRRRRVLVREELRLLALRHRPVLRDGRQHGPGMDGVRRWTRRCTSSSSRRS